MIDSSRFAPLARPAPAPWTAVPRLLLGRRLWLEAVVFLSFLGAILTTNYALSALPNVKLFDLMVFVAGYTLGARRGAAIAMGAWAVYGTVNPFGAAGPLLLAILMTSEVVYALAGAALRKIVPPERLLSVPGRQTILFAAAALLCTLAYDGVTNIYTGISWAQMSGGIGYGSWVLLALTNPGALFFSALHVGSNLFLFSFLGPLLIKGAEKGKRALRWER